MSVLAGHGSPFAVACHEAGHAVAFTVMNVPYSAVTIRADDTTFGRVTGQPSEAHRRAVPYVLGLLAGSLAEATITGRALDDIAESCGALDLWLADQLCAGMDAGVSNVLIARAGQLVERELPAIRAVAADLVVYERLTADQVAAIVGQYPPATPAGAAPSPGGQPS